MRAVVAERYGPPSALEVCDEPEPVFDPAIQCDRVLIDVAAASINPADWHMFTGTPWLVRLVEGLRRPNRRIPGVDFAGRVAAVGNAVTDLAPGDDVCGMVGGGAFAEQVVAKASDIVLRPQRITAEQGSTLGIAAFTALQALRDKGTLQAGERVLVNGAAGGCGTFAVQIAVALGAQVTGVCSSRNVEMVRGLGAMRVIDYRTTDFTTEGLTYDLIIDNVGNRSIRDLKRAMTPTGRWISVSGPKQNRLFGPMLVAARRVLGFVPSKRTGIVFVAGSPPEDLVTLCEMVTAEHLTPVVERTYPLDQVAEAFDYLATGHARAKLVLVP